MRVGCGVGLDGAVGRAGADGLAVAGFGTGVVTGVVAGVVDCGTGAEVGVGASSATLIRPLTGAAVGDVTSHR